MPLCRSLALSPMQEKNWLLGGCSEILESVGHLSCREKLSFVQAAIQNSNIYACLYQDGENLFPIFPLVEPWRSHRRPVRSEMGRLLENFFQLPIKCRAASLACILEEVPLSLVVGMQGVFAAIPGSEDVIQSLSLLRDAPVVPSPESVSPILEELSVDRRINCAFSVMEEFSWSAAIWEGDKREGGAFEVYEVFQIAQSRPPSSDKEIDFLGGIASLPFTHKASRISSLFRAVPIATLVGAFDDCSEPVLSGEYKLFPGKRAGCYIYDFFSVEDIFCAVANAYIASRGLRGE